MAKPAKLSKSERGLLIAAIIFTALLLGVLYWRYTLEINPVISVPAPVPAYLNSLEYYARASEMVGALKATASGRSYGLNDLKSFWLSNLNRTALSLPPSASQPTSEWEIANVYAQRLVPAFTILHQGMSIDPREIHCRAGELPPRYGESGLARALALAGRVNAHNGDWAGATDCDLDAVQLGEEIPHGGDIFAYLDGRLCEDFGRSGAWAAIPHLSGTQARAAARRMESIIARTPSYVKTLQFEKERHAGTDERMFPQTRMA